MNSDQAQELRLSIANRLKQERMRLGFDQQEFAQGLGVAKTTQCNYEVGNRTPGAMYLVRAAASGVDPLFVLTGRRDLMLLSAENESLLAKVIDGDHVGAARELLNRGQG